MSLSSYQIFCSIVAEGSLAKAAEVMSISPSAVSHALIALEREFGFTLLTRSRSGIALTSNGECLLEHMRMILSYEKKLMEEVDMINGLKKGLVRIGTINSVCINLIPDILNSFRKKYPNINVNIYQGGYEEMESMVLSGKLDLSFVTLPASENLSTISLLHDRLLCITSKDFRPKNPGYVTIEDIRGECLVLPGQGYDNDVKAFVKKHNLDIRRQNQHHVVDDSSIIALVESGMGISILPELVMKKITGNYNIYPLEDEEFRHIALATLKKQTPSPATAKMIEEIVECVRKFSLMNVNITE